MGWDEPYDYWPDPDECPRCHSDRCECCQECGARPDEPCGVECSEWRPPAPKVASVIIDDDTEIPF